MDGLLYEPRAFWSVARVDTSASQPRPPRRVRFDRQHFMNGEKFPVTLTRLLVAPVNFTFQVYEDAAPLTTANFRNDGVATLEFTDLLIGAPQRQYYIRNPASVRMFTPAPSYTPVSSGVNGIPSASSSLWGLSRWDFDHAMVIPKLGDLEFEMASFTQDGTLVGAVSRPAVQILFNEVGSGLLNGAARPANAFLLNSYHQPPGAVYAYPFQPDGFGPPLQGTTPQVWPPTQRLSARRFGAENPTRDGAIPVTGFAVMIDQRAYDADVVANHIPAPTTAIVSPLALNVPVRARMRNGGTGAYWWRQGAPLALVCPTITPAQVYELPQPITLGPGDRLDLEMTVPAPVTINNQPVGSIYQLGVSLTGFAAIAA